MRSLRAVTLMLLTLCVMGCERDVEVFGVPIDANASTVTPVPSIVVSTTPTTTPQSTTTPTTIPSPTAATTYVPATPYPMPTAAAFPGDMTLTLSYELLLDPPRTVQVTSVVKGGMDNSFDMYCASMTFDYGDGTVMTMMPDCTAWTPEYRFARTSVFEHTYERSGTYKVRFRYEGNTNADGTYIGVARVLPSNVLEVVIP